MFLKKPEGSLHLLEKLIPHSASSFFLLLLPPTDGLLDCNGSQQQQHSYDSRGELHLQRYHYYGHRHLWRSNQLHLHYWSGRLTAHMHLHFLDPLHHGSLSPPKLLLKPGAHSPHLLCLNTPPHLPPHYPMQSSLSQRPQD